MGLQLVRKVAILDLFDPFLLDQVVHVSHAGSSLGRDLKTWQPLAQDNLQRLSVLG